MASMVTIVVIVTAMAEMGIVAEYFDPIHNATVEKTLEGVEPLLNQQTKLSNERFAEQAKQTEALETQLRDLERSMTSAVEENRQLLSEILESQESLMPVTFLRRQDGTVDFYRKWADYKAGFGDTDGEFWLGLDSLHWLTSGDPYKLRVDLTDWSGERNWAEYATFRVASETDKFELTVSGYNPASTAGDSMSYHNGMFFSTKDRDNDHREGSSCAVTYQGGWWYKYCHTAQPTGVYKPANYRGGSGVYWFYAYKDERSFKEFTMKLIKA